jgi:RNA polymerase sigma-70 factor (ECF subfamily)
MSVSPSDVHPSIASTEFRALFESEFSYVCRSLRRCGVRDADVEDLAHDVFLGVHARLPEFDRARPIKPWLFGISFRVASHHTRRPGYRREEAGTVAVDPTDETPPVDTQIEAAERRQLVLSALDALDEDRRNVLVMHDLDELPMRDIAEELGIPVFTAYSRLRAAREQFAQAIRAPASPRRWFVSHSLPPNERLPPDIEEFLRAERAYEPEPAERRERVLRRVQASTLALTLGHRPSPKSSKPTVHWVRFLREKATVGIAAVVVAAALIGTAAGFVGGYRTGERAATPGPARAPLPAPIPPALPPSELPAEITLPSAPAPSAAIPRTIPRGSAEVRGRDDNLAAETALIQRARTALARGDSAGALEATEAHARQFPRGRLAEERESIAIQALVAAGRNQEARARASEFLAKYPKSMFRPAVEVALSSIR